MDDSDLLTPRPLNPDLFVPERRDALNASYELGAHDFRQRVATWFEAQAAELDRKARGVLPEHRTDYLLEAQSCRAYAATVRKMPLR